jgi:hypothetical protein
MATAVIGITGKKRSGKDTFAARLIEEHGFTQVRFADPLRAMLKAQNPIVDFIEWGTEQSPEEVRLTDVLGPEDDWEVAKELPEVRRLMQALGTEAGRDILGTNIWVNTALKMVEAIDGPVVITDARFPNEAELVTDIGTLVRITRPSLGVSTDLHPSETALDDWWVDPDFDVVNDGTIADLHAHADRIARHDDVRWQYRI